MSETSKKVSLDAALREWPDLEKTAAAWEEMAQRIDERVRSDGPAAPGATVAYVSTENLFSEPLGQIEGEGHNSAAPVKIELFRDLAAPKGETMTMPADRERDRRSLQDLAKMATQSSGAMAPSSSSSSSSPPSVKAPHSSAPSGVVHVQRAAEAKKDDSGIVDLAMAAQSDPQGAIRAQTTPLANDGLFDDEPASIRPGPVSASLSAQQLQQPAPSVPPSAAAAAAAAAAPESAAPASLVSLASLASQASVRPVSTQAKKGNGAVIALIFGGLVAASSMAAGGFFYMRHERAKAAEATLAMNTAVNTPPIVTFSGPADPKPVEAPAPSVDSNPTAAPAGQDPKLVAASNKGKAPVVAVANNKPAPPVKEEAAKLSQKDLPTAPVGPEGDLNKGMAAAVGEDGKPLQAVPAANTGPQFATGSVPQKPSQGAVTGAIGAVLPGARACLGPDDPVSRASITFTSGGAVQAVNVTGGAAGKPAAECIKAALGKAKLAPFAEATYTANITVRH